jgi:MFS family permease
LVVLCLAELMIVLDTTIVNVALPSIRSDLGFSETSLAWVVNAYLLHKRLHTHRTFDA